MKENLLPFGRNKNGTIYSKDSCDWSKIKEMSDKNMLMGELRHEAGIYPLDTSFSKISHSINDLEVNDDGIWGDIKILDTSSGRVLQELLKDKDIYNIGISSRFTGKIRNGIVEIDDLYSFDYVYTPQSTLQKRRKKLNRILNRMNNV